MTHPTRPIVALLMVVTCAVPAALADDATIVLSEHTFNDPGSANMPSHTVLTPKDWNVEGGAWWPNRNGYAILPSQSIIVTAPDGTRVHVGPSLVFSDYHPSPQAMQYGVQRPQQGASDAGVPVLYMPGSLDEWQMWMTQNLPNERPGAADVQVRVSVVPELTELLQRQLAPIAQQQQQANMQNRQMGLDMSQSIDAAVLAFECRYTQDGKQWDELAVIGVTILGSNMQTGTSIRWIVEPNVAYRAPSGQLDAAMPLLMTIANSVRQTPQWTKMKLDHAAAMNQIAAKGAADRSRIIAESNREINRMITEGYEQRQATQDRSHERFINAIREVDDYTVPGSNTQVQLPSGYDHVYSNGNGEYILSNDSLYNPNTDPTVNNHNWQNMQTVP